MEDGGIWSCGKKKETNLKNYGKVISRNLKNQGSWSSLSQLQKELWQELETLILQEDIMWAQKARC